MGPVLAIAIKDIRLLLRDKAAVFFTFAFPVIIGVFFGTVFAGGSGEDGPRKISIALVDEDASGESGAFVKQLAECGHFNVTPAVTRDEAVKQVRLGKQAAAVVLPKGFGAGTDSLFAGSPTTIEVGCDPSRSAEAGMINGLLTEQAFKRLSRMFSDTSRMKDMARSARLRVKGLASLSPERHAVMNSFYDDLDRMLDSLDSVNSQQTAPNDAAQPASPSSTGTGGFNPVSIKTLEVQPGETNGPKNAYAVTFAQAIMWGVIGCCSGFAISLLTERQSGTLIRLRLAPLGWNRVLGGKALACAATTLLVGAVMVAVAVVIFKVRPVSWPMLVFALLCVAVCFVGIMMLLAVIGRMAKSSQIAWPVMLVFTLAGGGSIPLFAMPEWLQKASGFSPVKWGILAVEGGLWRGFSAQDMALPCGVLLAVGVVGFGLGARLFARDTGA